MALFTYFYVQIRIKAVNILVFRLEATNALLTARNIGYEQQLHNFVLLFLEALNSGLIILEPRCRIVVPGSCSTSFHVKYVKIIRLTLCLVHSMS